VRRPALQRRSPLGHQLAFVVDAGDAAAQPTGVVDCHLDHIGLDAEIGEPGDESSPQIVQSPRRRISHGGVAQKVLDKNADYILALKGNQGTLREDVELFAAEQRA
jgi:predicted transposase YbfD/YdcC